MYTPRPQSSGKPASSFRGSGSFPSRSSTSSRPSSTGPRKSFSSAGGRPSFGGSRPSSYRGGSSSGRPSFNRGGNRGGGNRGNTGARINPAMFVNKAIITEEVEVFVPEHKFADFKLKSEELKNNILARGYKLPTPIQDKSIPHVLMGQDVVGIANTGTGKTAAFLIPLMDKLLASQQEKVLVVVPTRELAIQIEDEFKGFVQKLRLRSTCCVGGAYIGQQISSLRNRPQMVIGTPGRLKDLVDRKCLNLNEFNTIVLDEADRMLDMGFINDMKLIMSKMPATRHTLFFSATLSPEIEALIKQFLRNPVTISVKTRDTSKNVDQDVVRVENGKNKIDMLHDLLKDGSEFNKVLIFGRTKHGVEKLSQELLKRGFKSESIHGDKTHSRRQRALSLFKNDNVQVLVATDVAARGLDIAGVSHVINYDLPATYEDYVHRIGRTGRAGKKGKALTFLG